MHLDNIYILHSLVQRENTNIQNFIQNAELQSPSSDQNSLKPHVSKGSLKEEKSSTGTIVSESETEVSKLSCEDFMEWLMIKGYSIQDCQAFRGIVHSYFICDIKSTFYIQYPIFVTRSAKRGLIAFSVACT